MVVTKESSKLAVVKFIARVSDMGEGVKVIRVPKKYNKRVEVVGKKEVLVTLDDNFLDKV